MKNIHAFGAHPAGWTPREDRPPALTCAPCASLLVSADGGCTCPELPEWPGTRSVPVPCWTPINDLPVATPASSLEWDAQDNATPSRPLRPRACLANVFPVSASHTNDRFLFLREIGGPNCLKEFLDSVILSGPKSPHWGGTLIIDQRVVLGVQLRIPDGFTLAGVGINGGGRLVFKNSLSGKPSTALVPTTTMPSTMGEAGGIPGGGLGEARWVLRDKDGVRVKALVEPRCGAWSNITAQEKCAPLEFMSPNSFPCVRVVDYNGRFLNIQYDLETGRIEPCNLSDDNSIGYEKAELADVLLQGFGTPNCDGPPFGPAVAGEFGDEFTSSKRLWFIAGDPWYPGEVGCGYRDMWYRDLDLMCKGPYQAGYVCPMLAVPDWAQDLLPNPPYSMKVEDGTIP